MRPPVSRTVCWWSAGAASATATKIALEKRPDAIVAYCDLSKVEHPDNERFIADCERWYGKKILRLRSDKYVDTWDVYEKTRWLIGPAGARCTTELKKLVRRAFQLPDDVHVWGYTTSEPERLADFKANNPELDSWFPLIDAGLSHPDCLAALRHAGIELPMMYRLGYKNNNCIGCVKGGMGYWNKIRVDFPEVFARMSKTERTLDAAILKKDGPKDENGKRARLRVFLDELPPDAGRYEAEPDIECGPACLAVPK
jgi:hypothetical protein